MAEELILDLVDAVKEKFDKELKPIKSKLAELILKLQNIEKVIGLRCAKCGKEFEHLQISENPLMGSFVSPAYCEKCESEEE
ncbi:MAG: hypothetical protein QXN87_02230 [Candidatus Bathyarchaeia archaeon]